MITVRHLSRWGLEVCAVIAALGLWFHARSYDFFADDAFITLRYGQNLWEHGAPVYNLGQHVEGYTSPLWMLLAAVAHAFTDPVPAMKVFGGLSAVLWLAGLVRLWKLLMPSQPAGGVLVLSATALAAPVAAWTMGGLETPIFGALLTWSIAEAAVLSTQQLGYRRAAAVGALLALTTFARPEGALVGGVVGVCLLGLRLQKIRWRAPAITLATFGLVVGAHVAWRTAYYGYPLPNTYYLKSSGEAAALAERGLSYVNMAAREMGWPLVVLLVIGVLFPVLCDDPDRRRVSRAIAWPSKLLLLLFVPYVIRVGGDFLDLYRFFAPVLPLGFVLVASAGQTLVSRFRVPWPGVLSLGLALLVVHGRNQVQLRERALQVSEPSRAEQGVEPLGWTRLYARRWGALGRWVSSLAEPDEWMAVGAAGAMPYYAGISNLDTFGLCDDFVAHHGASAGSRPGHQRFAPFDYMVRRRPTFIFVNDFSRDRRMPQMRSLPHFQRAGYRLVEAHVTAEEHGAPETFYHYLYVRSDRADAFEGRSYFRGR